MNRYFSSQWGRFLSPDPYSGSVSPGNPQSWNRYAYLGGDPVNGNDPLGLFLSGPGAADGTPGQVWAYDPTADNWMNLALIFGTGAYSPSRFEILPESPNGDAPNPSRTVRARLAQLRRSLSDDKGCLGWHDTQFHSG